MSIISGGHKDCKRIITGTGERLDDRSATGRKRPWEERKKQNEQLRELFSLAREIESDIISDSRMKSLCDCASWLEFAQREDNTRKLTVANFCRLRLCPMCAWRRSLKLFSQVSTITDAILRDKKVRFIFVTFTIKNVKGEDLQNAIKRMNLGFSYLTQAKKKFLMASKLQENLLGYLKAVEVTYNARSDDFHPHIHCIFEVKPSYFTGESKWGSYLNHASWVALWRAAMKLDYDPQVNVKAIKNTKAKAVAEVAKYPIKPDGLLKMKDKQQAARALIQLKKGIHNCRFVAFGGDFKEYKKRLYLDDVENGDLVHVETDTESLNAVAYVWFRWHARIGVYVC